MQLIRTILSLTFAAMVFISSSSFSVGMHLCGGRVNAVAFLSEADGCGHQQFLENQRKAMHGCCEDETVSYHSQDFNSDITSVQVLPAPFIAVSHNTFLIAEITPDVADNFKYSFYDPPLPSSDRVVINQIFLI